jgi:uncharacterized protein with NRDE domain
MKFHYDVIDKNFRGLYNLLYTDTDSLVYNVIHSDIYEWIKNNKQYFDLSESHREDLRDNENKKVLGKFKDELNSLLLKEFTGLTPNGRAYSFNSNASNGANYLTNFHAK